MVYDREGRKLWIVEDTGRHKPVGSWDELEKRLRRADLPDWWVIAKDIGWRPPTHGGGSLLSMQPDELRAALAAAPAADGYGADGAGSGGTGTKLGCGGKYQEQYDTSNGRYVGNGGGSGGGGSREGGGTGGGGGGGQPRTKSTPPKTSTPARTGSAPTRSYKAAGADRTPPPPKWPDSDPPTPPGVDLEKNMREAEAHRYNLIWFYTQVDSEKPWDYKNVKEVNKSERIEDFGNFNYGATGAALGVPDEILYRAAGFKQINDHRDDPTKHTEPDEFPYGDDPRDADMIRRGIEYYRHWKARQRVGRLTTP